MGNELTGKALKDRASELNIKGRSSMSADELRTAITLIEDAARVEPTDAEVVTTIDRIVTSTGMDHSTIGLMRQATSNALGSASPMSPERRMQVMLAAPKITPKMARRARKAENRAKSK